jgi:hypothetical protein
MMNFKIDLVNTRDGNEWYRQIGDKIDMEQAVSLSQILNKIYRVESGKDIFYGVDIIKMDYSDDARISEVKYDS